MVRTICNYFINRTGKLPDPNTRRRIATGIRTLFPDLFSNADTLLPLNASQGKLGTTFRNCWKTYRKRNGLSSRRREDVRERSVEDQETIPADDLELLKNPMADESSIQQKLEETKTIRRNSILQGSRIFLFELFFVKPKFIAYDFNLLWPENTFLEKKGHVFGKLNEEFERRFDGKKAFISKIDEEWRVYGKIIVLLYNSSEKKFEEQFASILHTVNENVSVSDINALSASKPQPFIVRRDSEPAEFMIAVDARTIPLPTNQFGTFDDAFLILFKIFHLWNIAYAKETSKLFEFIDHAFFEITANNNRSHKISELLSLVTNEE